MLAEASPAVKILPEVGTVQGALESASLEAPLE
jgi:hypothetical protein